MNAAYRHHASKFSPEDVAAMLGHGPEWHAARAKGIGGSDAKHIMSADWLPLWLDKTGQAEPEDLSDVLAVQMGTWTEALNRYWYGKQTGNTVLDAESVTHPDHPFLRVEPDGLVKSWPKSIYLECKHTGAYAKDDEILTRYFPQLQHGLLVTGLDVAHLSVFFGSNKWAHFEVAADADYQAEYLRRATEFWRMVEAGERPATQEDATVAVSMDDMREADMTGNNAWASFAAEWLAHKAAAAAFKTAEKEIKSLVDADVKLATGHGIKCARSKAGALSIKEA